MSTRIGLPNMTSTLMTYNFHIRVAEAGYTFRLEYHPTFELLYCWEGNATEYIQERPVPFRTGDLLLIKPGVKHRFLNQAAGPVTFISIHFDIDDPELRKKLIATRFERLSKADTEKTMIPRYMEQIESVIYSCVLQTKYGVEVTDIPMSSVDKLAIQAFLLLIVKELAVYTASVKEQDDYDCEEQHATPYETKIAHLIEDLLRLCAEDALTIQDIARHIGLSRGQCTKIFTKVYGMPPRQYMTELKLRKAKELLVRSQLSVEAIAAELRYDSVSHFSRQFKRWTGLSPLQFRPKHLPLSGVTDASS